MKTTTKLGIWMDNSTVNLMEFTSDPVETKTIESNFINKNAKSDSDSDEIKKFNAEQHQHLDYFKSLSDIIKHYDEVILFGPIDSKVELYNTVNADHNFAKTKIEIKQTDKMTENQQHAFVKEHFSGQKFQPIPKFVVL